VLVLNSGAKIRLRKLFNKRSYQDRIKSLFKLEKDPKKIARSISLGTFFGIILPMGIQTIVTIPLSVLFKCNIVISSGATLITNPITIVPIYTLAVMLGEIVTGIYVQWDYIESFIAKPNLDSLIALGSEVSIVLITGLLIMGTIFSTLFYAVSFYAVRFSKGLKTDSEEQAEGK
jgi:uncharacterized protein (DUF2062 family)